MSTRFLAVNFGGLGDEILFLPTLASIRACHPDWHIALLTEPRSQAIAQLTNLVDESLIFDVKKQPLTIVDRIKLIGLLRAYKPDVILSSGSTPLVSVLLQLSGARKRVGYGTSWLGQLLLTDPVHLNKQQYAGWMYHDLVTGLGINRQPHPPTITLTQEALETGKQLLQLRTSQPSHSASPPGKKKTEKIILLHPGTSRLAIQKGIIKTWPASSWVGLARLLLAAGHQVVLCGGPDDKEIIDRIVSLLPESQKEEPAPQRKTSNIQDQPDVLQASNSIQQENKNRNPESKKHSGIETAVPGLLNLNGQTKNVSELAAMMQISDLIICVDSAPMHIAAALNRPLVAIFGPTEPEYLILPGSERKILQGKVMSRNETPDESGVQIPINTVYLAAADLLRST